MQQRAGARVVVAVLQLLDALEGGQDRGVVAEEAQGLGLLDGDVHAESRDGLQPLRRHDGLVELPGQHEEVGRVAEFVEVVRAAGEPRAGGGDGAVELAEVLVGQAEVVMARYLRFLRLALREAFAALRLFFSVWA
ncbi:MAG: hypothetical protein HGA45_40915 [Chloroflexales bacterium]|nr:hypothetical protein [Chloroflexales bacterium]